MSQQMMKTKKLFKKLLIIVKFIFLKSEIQFCDKWGLSSAGRAPRWQRGGQGFDSPRLHQSSKGLKIF